jgi:hypothetical protein
MSHAIKTFAIPVKALDKQAIPLPQDPLAQKLFELAKPLGRNRNLATHAIVLAISIAVSVSALLS